MQKFFDIHMGEGNPGTEEIALAESHFVIGDVVNTSLTIPGNTYNAGDLVLVAVTWRNGNVQISSITDGSNQWSLQSRQDPGGYLIFCQMAYCVISSSKANQDIVITFAAEQSWVRALAIVLNGNFPVDPRDVYTAAYGSSNYPAITTGALAQASEFVLMLTQSYSEQTATPDTADGFIELADSNGLHLQYKIVSDPGSLVVSAQLSASDYWTSLGASYKNTP